MEFGEHSVFFIVLRQYSIYTEWKHGDFCILDFDTGFFTFKLLGT